MARNDVDVLQERWRLLLTLSPPPNVRQMIEEQLAALGSDVTPAAGPAASPADPLNGAISVRVSLADELQSKVNAGAMLFLVAREPGRPGPPVAVVRQSAENLPSLLTISDANAMLPGRTISGLERVQLIARIANSGEPTAQPGDISGEVVLETSAALAEPVSIRLDSIVP